jgi:hypothetical protein
MLYFLIVNKCGRTLDASWMLHAAPKALSEHNSEMKSKYMHKERERVGGGSRF